MSPRTAAVAAAVVGVLGPLGAAGAAESCAAGGASCDADPSMLLQVKQQDVQRHTFGGLPGLAAMWEQSFDWVRQALAPRIPDKDMAKFSAKAREAKAGMCLGTKVKCESQTAGLVPEKTPQHTMWYNMPPQDLAQMQAYHANLTSVELPPVLANLTNGAVTLAQGPAGKVARMMYEATKVEGVPEKVPRELRGVYWMKGNPVPEELMVIQHAQWHEEEGLLVLPWAPWMWSWAAGRPTHAPSDLYSESQGAALANAQSLILSHTAISAKFGTCKEGTKYTNHPIVCNTKKCEDRMAYGYMQIHQFGNMTEASDVGSLLSAINNNPSLLGVSGAFTLQKHPHSKDGSMWRRTSQWGKGGSCASIESGSYDLVKVIDADGNFVQPWYDEFIKYMGDVPLMTWSGWTGEAGRQESKATLEMVVAKMQSGEWPRLMPVLEC